MQQTEHNHCNAKCQMFLSGRETPTCCMKTHREEMIYRCACHCDENGCEALKVEEEDEEEEEEDEDEEEEEEEEEKEEVRREQVRVNQKRTQN